MIPIKILDETAPLEAVVLGTAESFGGTPSLEETYDPKSKEHLKAGVFPTEPALMEEMEAVAATLRKHQVRVCRPYVMTEYNQIFARDIAFVIDDKLVVPNVISFRDKESEGIRRIIEQVDHVLYPSSEERIEGGDVIPWKGHLFIGYSRKEDFQKYQVARTNESGLDYMRKHFADWKVQGFELVKSDDDPRNNALHLDCCFQPVGKDKAVICPSGFKNEEDVQFVLDLFGTENVFQITKDEMYEMNANFVSISPEVVISDGSFDRLNDQLRKWGMQVEEVKYREVTKMGGLLRCTTLPLRRRYD